MPLTRFGLAAFFSNLCGWVDITDDVLLIAPTVFDLNTKARRKAVQRIPCDESLGVHCWLDKGGQGMAKAEASVEELVAMIERGDLRLPEMQRQYVWRSTRVRDLLDSLYRGYPSGAILLWETDEEVPERKFSISQGKTPYKSTRLLLDGQQRLTSLSAVIRGEPVAVRGRQKPIELLFNLEHPDRLAFVTEVNEDGNDEEEEDGADELDDADDSTEDELQKRINQMMFVVATKKIAALPQWVKVSDVFKADNDAPFLQAAGIQGFDDPRYKKYSERLAKLRAIRKYVYRMDVLDRELSYDEVTEIFVRVNSLGAKLRSSDLALAQITARWRNSLELFLKFQQSCKKHGFDLDLGIHLRNLMVFASGQSRFLTVGRYDAAALQLAWKECCKGMEYAMNFLRSNVGVDSPALLASPFLMIVVAYFGHIRKYKVGVKESTQLRYWVLVANAKGRFSRGSSETLLDQDIATLRDGGKVDALIDRLRLQVGRLDITSEELEGRNQRSALFKTMFLAFRASGAKDWLSELAIELDHSGTQHRLQFHHIFPKGQLKKHYSVREIDDIANLAFIGGKTNRVILDKPPAKYLPSLVEQRGTPTFEAQAIPLKANLLEIESYKNFLSARRKKIAGKLNAFLNDELK
ncbi:GmrSD restriction endonuclease domain-containing protein [Burkholderia pseudomallei]|uniref:GmrSD restriction endonuclease domain-containing protein n=1 Tax=Burkholderia pseudomallei TaxID=28450 RepID=UPI001FCAE5B2|nr:DUF262 domain-containing protein [Burkholderia pseudomallei]